MATTNANNASKVQPPVAASIAGLNASASSVLIYFRQSPGDGSTYVVTPVYLHPADAGQAIARAPYEYSMTATGFATWPGSYNNSTQPVAGRGRLLGATSFAD